MNGLIRRAALIVIKYCGAAKYFLQFLQTKALSAFRRNVRVVSATWSMRAWKQHVSSLTILCYNNACLASTPATTCWAVNGLVLEIITSICRDIIQVTSLANTRYRRQKNRINFAIHLRRLRHFRDLARLYHPRRWRWWLYVCNSHLI